MRTRIGSNLAMTSSSAHGVAVLLYTAAAAFLFLAAHAAHDINHHHKYKEDLVAHLCDAMEIHDWSPLLTRNFCESTLRSDKRSIVAKNPRQVVLVAMDLLGRAASAADAKVDDVLRSGGGSGRHGLRYCRLDYDAMARTIPVCRALVQNFKPRVILNSDNVYSDCAARLGSAAADCWGYVLDDDEVAKVVSKEVGEVFQRASLVRAMIEEMLYLVEGYYDH